MKKLLLPAFLIMSFIAAPVTGQSLEERLRTASLGKSRNPGITKPMLLGALVNQDISVNFGSGTMVEDAISVISDKVGVEIKGRFESDNVFGLPADTEIEGFEVADQPAVNVLELVLDQAGDSYGTPCTWQIRNGYIEIGDIDSQSGLSRPSARETRLYPILDLIYNPPYFDNAPDFDLNSAITQGGGGGGGGGGGSGGGGGGSGGRGGGGGGGSGGGGGGGGGGLFGSPSSDPERLTDEERAEQLRTIIEEFIEPDAWGDYAQIRYYQGNYIIRAPDWLHRQIAGYPYAPQNAPASSAPGTASERRYVIFSSKGTKIEGHELNYTPVKKDEPQTP